MNSSKKTMISFNTNDLLLLIVSIVAGLCNNIFHMVNGLQSVDSICSIVGINKGSLIGEGKFIACILDDFTKILGIQLCIPFINEFLLIVLIALGSIILSKMFKISKTASILLCIIMQCSSATLESVSFNHYCHMHYMGFIFIIFAAYFLINKNIIFFIISFILSLGIYYAFIPFYIMTIVIFMLIKFIRDEYNIKSFLKDIVYYATLTLVALILYIVLYRIYKYFNLVENSAYLGISDNVIATSIGFKRYLIQIAKSFITLPYLLVCDYVNFNNMTIQKISIGICYIIIIFYLFLVLKRKFNRNNLIMFLILAFGLLLGFGFSKIVSPLNVPVRSTYQFIFIYILPVILYDVVCFNITILKRIIIANSILFISIMFLQFNRTHYIQYIENNYAKNYLNNLVLRIESIDSYNTNMPILFYKTPILNERVSANIGGGGNNVGDILVGRRFTYSLDFFTNFKYKKVNKEQYDKITNTDLFKEMSLYPNDNSIRIIDDIIVIKFQN